MLEKNYSVCLVKIGLLLALGNAGLATSASVQSLGTRSAAGQQITGGDVLIDSTMDTWVGESSAGDHELRAGFAGQLYDVVALKVSALPGEVAEEQAVAFGVAGRCDDGTFLAADTETWSLLTGPLATLDGNGQGVAAPVYQTETARVAVAALNLVATGEVRVLDVDPDNFGLYAHDEIQDLWQVAYFGPSSTNGLAGANPDGDQDNNHQEFIVGTDPLSAQSAFRVALARGGGLRVSGAPAYTSRVYRLERTANLRSGTWTPEVAGTGSMSNGQWVVAGLSDTNPLVQYRMLVEYPWR